MEYSAHGLGALHLFGMIVVAVLYLVPYSRSSGIETRKENKDIHSGSQVVVLLVILLKTLFAIHHNAHALFQSGLCALNTYCLCAHHNI